MGTQKTLAAAEALGEIVEDQKRLTTKVSQLERTNQALHDENVDLKETLKRYKPYQSILDDGEQKAIMVWLHDPLVIKMLKLRMTQINQLAMQEYGQKNPAGKLARALIDKMIENCIEHCLTAPGRWAEFRQIYYNEYTKGSDSQLATGDDG